MASTKGKKATEAVEEVKAVVSEEVEEVKESVEEVKTPAKRGRKPGSSKAAKKAAEEEKVPAKRGRKPVAEKAAEEANEHVILQLGYAEYTLEDIINKCKADYAEDSSAKLSSIDVYVKPQDHKAYYVVNDKNAGSVDL